MSFLVVRSNILLAILMLGGRLMAQTTNKEMDALMAPYLQTNNFYGTVYVAKAGKVLYEKSFGSASLEGKVPNTNATKYQLASVSKPFTSSAILLLEQQGKLSTADPVSKFLPNLTRGNEITIHQLLVHTSGIQNINDFPEYDLMAMTTISLDSIVKVFQKKPLLFEPGSKYSYSNSNYNVLAYIIEKASGMNYGDFLKKNLFDPLGMSSTGHHGNAFEVIDGTATGYAPDGRRELQRARYVDWSIKTGNGSLYSTVEDLARFDRALYSDKILGERLRKGMFTPDLSEVAPGWYIRPHFRRNRAYISGRAPGFSTYFARYPDDELCIIVLSNLYIPSTREIGEGMAAIVFGEQPVRRTLTDEALSGDEVKSFVGSYQFGPDFFTPNSKIEITAVNGRLAFMFGDLIRDGANQFIPRRFWTVLAFERDASGAVTGLTFEGARAKKMP